MFDLQAWQLLVPDLSPNNPPVVRGESDAEKALWRKVDGLMRELGELRSEAQTGPGKLSD